MSSSVEEVAHVPVFPCVVMTVSVDDLDMIIADLFEAGASGIEQRDSGTLTSVSGHGVVELHVSFESGDDADVACEAFVRFAARRADIVGDQWRDGWKEHYHPFNLTEGIVVVPPWESYLCLPGERKITIDPGRAFGTGLHATTKLVAAAIDELAPRLDGHAVLDVGCGSGILALCALFRGARFVRAIDCDPAAIQSTNENAQLNGLSDQVLADTTDVADLVEQFPVVLANIEARVLLAMAKSLTARLAPGGRLVLSGVLGHQVDDVVAGFAPLYLERRADLGEWASLVMRD